MTHDDPLPERYADLLGPQPDDDPALARLVADLDALHAASEPPVTLAAALDRAIHERVARVAPEPGRAERQMVTRAPRTPYRSQSEGQTPMAPRRLSALLGGLAAVLVVGLMAALLLSVRPALGLVGGLKGTPCGTATPLPRGGWITSSGRATSTPAPTPSPTPASSTSSAKASLIQNVVTATGVDNKLFPTGVTSQFPMNSSVYVVMAVQGIQPGETHTISIRWFLNGQDIQLPPTAGSSVTVSGDRQIFFSLVYPQPGAGTAKIYFDRPASDTGDTPNDPALAATVSFAVEPQGAAPTPTPSPTPTASPTTASAGGAPTTPATVSGSPTTSASGICPTPTASPTATLGSSGAATPTATPTATPPATPTPTPSHA